MSEFLSKEEIKQWRSSLEKITLEEYAARLGKKIAEDKHTNDLADIVLHGQPVVSTENDWIKTKTERISSIAQRAFDREQEIAPSPFSLSKLKLNSNDFKASTSSSDKKVNQKPAAKKAAAPKKTAASKSASAVETGVSKSNKTASAAKSTKAAKAKKAIIESLSTGDAFRDEIRVVFKKALTDREQRVFDYFSEHQNEVVYAKDLAQLLDLPRDYVYKYIKNLRAKIEGEKLENADKGGFILHI